MFLKNTLKIDVNIIEMNLKKLAMSRFQIQEVRGNIRLIMKVIKKLFVKRLRDIEKAQQKLH